VTTDCRTGEHYTRSQRQRRGLDFFAACVEILRRAGTPAWELAAGLEVFRAAGWGYLLQHHRDSLELAALGDGPRDAVYRLIWSDAASHLGAEVRELAPGFLEIRKGSAATRVHHQSVMLDDLVTVKLALQKTLVDRLLVEAGLPVPEHLEFDLAELNRAVAFLERESSPCVVKPTSGAGGASVTAGIRTRSQLLRATLKASRFFPRLVIERQATGATYRLLFLDGQLLDVVRRLPPRVIGDGHSTIAELIDAENRRRRAGYGTAGLMPLRIDLDCLFTLSRSGLTPRSVPPPNTVIAVKTVTNQNCVRDNETVRQSISRELIATAASAVEVVGLRLAGVDLITTNPQEPLADSGGVIIEVNASPGLHHHYHVADAAGATRVAVTILQTLLEHGTLNGSAHSDDTPHRQPISHVRPYG
jgi:D-alanine-D-alanine ligase-like ATP-grasp enzyme